MGNKPKVKKCPVCNPSPATIEYVKTDRPITEKEIMYHITEECKKCKEQSNDLQERIRILNVNNTKLNKEKVDLLLKNKEINNNLTNIKNQYDLFKNQKKDQINFLNNKTNLNLKKISNLESTINLKDNDIKKINEKLLENNCQRNYTLANSVKSLNQKLSKCNIEKENLEKRTDNSTKSSQNCTAVQIGLQNQVNTLNKNLQDSDNTIKFKDSVIYNADRYISMWRTISFVFFILFFIFLFLYIFKRGNCGDFEEKLNNLKMLNKK